MVPITDRPVCYLLRRDTAVRDAVIVDAVRTPIAKGNSSGAYAGVHAVDLHAHALRSLVERTALDPGEVDDVIGGAVGQVGEQSTNTTRMAVLAAGFPESVPATTVDRQCGSSQQAISFAAQGVVAGAYDVVIASGVESMSRVPIGSSQLAGGERQDFAGPAVAARYPGGLIPQGVSAELIARKWGFTREQLDEFASPVTSVQPRHGSRAGSTPRWSRCPAPDSRVIRQCAPRRAWKPWPVYGHRSPIHAGKSGSAPSTGR